MKLRDILFKRYGDVSFLLSTIPFQKVCDFLSTMYREHQNDELWRVYLSNPFRETSFNDWKDEVVGSGKSKEQIETEAKTAADKALAMLNNTSGGAVNGG